MAKLLTGLDEKICGFDGVPIRVSTRIDDCPKCGYHAETVNAWTISDVLLQIISQSKLTGAESYVMYEIGQKIFNANGAPVKLDAFEMLKREIDNFNGYSLAVMHPVRKWLERMENTEFVDAAIVPDNGVPAKA